MNVEQCIEGGLLVSSVPDLEKARKSLEMAKHKLDVAEAEFGHGLFESAAISAYASMFHSARALLFKDGFKERSHFALFVFVNENYSNKIERKFLAELNSLRLQRHDLLYGLETNNEIRESEADSALKNAEGFLLTIKKILK